MGNLCKENAELKKVVAELLAENATLKAENAILKDKLNIKLAAILPNRRPLTSRNLKPTARHPHETSAHKPDSNNINDRPFLPKKLMKSSNTNWQRVPIAIVRCKRPASRRKSGKKSNLAKKNC
ncbi:hypothetical protein FACS189454_09170 [Planctomycetales bacterium]|nr:hypothetical protein FACS189454_09170 [Planctomycetales bacterium]